MRKTNSFTLIELVVSIALLSLMGSWLFFKGGDLIASYRSSKALHQFLEELHHSKILALSYRCSMVVKCQRQKDKIVFERLCYTNPHYSKMGLNEKLEIADLEIPGDIEISLNSLGEFQDQEWDVKTKNSSYRVSIHQNQISAKANKS